MSESFKYNNYILRKQLYLYLQKLIGGNLKCDFKIFDKYITSKLESKKLINVLQYKTLKNKILVCHNDKFSIKYSENEEPKLIVWNDLKQGFKEGKVSANTLRAIGTLRQLTLDYLLNSIHYKKECFINIGSDDLTSDLDFTHVYYNNMKNQDSIKLTVIELMIKFYNMFHSMYGNFPDITFDTNYYVSSVFLTEQCFEKVNDSFKKLFVKSTYNKFTGSSTNTLYRLYFSDFQLKQDIKKYENIDRSLCFLIQSEYIHGIHSSQHHDKLKKLIMSASIYYGLLSNMKKNYYDNKFILLLRTLYFFMTSYSNESYISDTTYNIIVLSNKMENELDNLLSFVDNYTFIVEWYMDYKDTNNLLGFFDMVCKYIVRCSMSLKTSSFKIDSDLIQHSKFWRENIRGKISLELLTDNIEESKLKELGKGVHEKIKKAKEVIDKLNKKNYTVESIYKLFKDLYDQVSQKFVITDTERQIKNIIVKQISTVKVKITDTIKYDNAIFNLDPFVKSVFDLIKD
jgi:hypothetical protein